jgi:CRISPR-associated protein Csd1
MILKALVELAENQSLTEDLDYQPMPVRWLLTIGRDGQLLGEMADTQRPPPGGKGKPVAAVRRIPNRSKRTTQHEAEFVIDKPEYVFGWFSEAQVKGNTEAERQSEVARLRTRAAKRHALYREEVRLAAERTGDEGLKALALFLERPVPALPPDLGEGDLIGFQYVEGDVGLITDRPAVRAYWATRRREAERGTGQRPRPPGQGTPPPTPDRVRCLITGELCTPVELHPKIKGIPPASDTKGGVQLTSVNAPAFVSYGLDGFGCAPVASNAADAYEKALNHLLADSRRSCRLAHNAVVVFWSKGDAGLVDLFSDAVTFGNPDSIRALYQSTWKGSPIHFEDLSPFYALTLSGAIGRGTVRGWHETTLGAVLTNLRQYFADLTIVRRPEEEGRTRPLLSLLRQLAVQGDVENIAPNLAAELFAAILAGRAFPRAVLDCAVRRIRSERTINGDRAAILKAFLCRARRAGQLENSPEVQVMLDEACLDPAYRLGRLFAVLEKVQEDAIGASATIRDRYYGAASATPIVVFPQLMRKLPHHLAKLDASTYYEKIIQQICSGLQPPTPFPAVLTLEQQGLFAVGYYHQRQALFTRREKPAETSKAEAQ